MQYYMIEWNDEDTDEPYRLYVEADNEGRILRKVEAYRVGWFQRFGDLHTDPIDSQELAGETGVVSALTEWQFSDMWSGVPDMPTTFMGAF